jgi:hypothetical protein
VRVSLAMYMSAVGLVDQVHLVVFPIVSGGEKAGLSRVVDRLELLETLRFAKASSICPTARETNAPTAVLRFVATAVRSSCWLPSTYVTSNSTVNSAMPKLAFTLAKLRAPN